MASNLRPFLTFKIESASTVFKRAPGQFFVFVSMEWSFVEKLKELYA